MTENRNTSEIESDIEHERAELKDTLGELSDRFSVEHVTREIGNQLRENGGEISRSVSRSVKENPLALAVTAVGLGWLIFGQGNRGTNDRSGTVGLPDTTDGHDPLPRVDSVRPLPDTRSAHKDPDWARPRHDEFDDTGDLRVYEVDVDVDDNDDHGSDGPGLAERGRDGLRKAKDRVGAGMASAKRGAGDRADAARRRADRVRARLSEGTENLTDQARERVIHARQRALNARDAVARQARTGADRAADFYEDQPLVVGALALAVGAALAGGLPRSRTEDRYLGQHSDSLMEDAERIFREESEKARAVVGAATDEAKTIAKEARQAADERTPGDGSAEHAARTEAEKAAERVKTAATDEAERQDLGKPNT